MTIEDAQVGAIILINEKKYIIMNVYRDKVGNIKSILYQGYEKNSRPVVAKVTSLNL